MYKEALTERVIVIASDQRVNNRAELESKVDLIIAKLFPAYKDNIDKEQVMAVVGRLKFGEGGYSTSS